MLQLAQLALEAVAQPLAVDERRAGKIEIEIAEDATAGQLAGELFQFIEMTGRMAGADDGADRCAGDDVRLDAGFVERLEDTDMGPAARRAAAQRQPDLRLGHVRHLLGCCLSDPGMCARLTSDCAFCALTPPTQPRRRNVSIRFRYRRPRLTLHYDAGRLALR